MSKLFWCKCSLLFAAFLLCGGTPARAQSLWRDDMPRSLVGDRKATRVGDILTILVQESASVKKDASTKTAKKSNIDASLQAFLYGPAASKLLTKGGQLPAMKMSGTSDFDGGGSINNSEQMTAKISVRVLDALPNGNLIIEGTRKTSFSGEKQEAILRGVVREVDVAANNTVFSYNIADANISFVSSGSVSDTQKKGWFTRTWDKIAPF